MENKEALLYDILYGLLRNVAGYNPSQASSLAKQATRYLFDRKSRSKRGDATLKLLSRIVSWDQLRGAGYLYFKEEIWRNRIQMRRLGREEDSLTSSQSSASAGTPKNKQEQ